MPKRAGQQEGGAETRVARRRRRLAASGLRRVEVTVPAVEVALVHEVAAALRAGGETAQDVRDRLEPLLRHKQAKTGRELLEFFLRSPLAGSNIEFERDRSPGRPIDLE